MSRCSSGIAQETAYLPLTATLQAWRTHPEKNKTNPKPWTTPRLRARLPVKSNAIRAKVSAKRYNVPDAASMKPVLMGLWVLSPPMLSLFLSTFCRLIPQNMMSPVRIIVVAGVMVYSWWLLVYGFGWLIYDKH